MSQSIYYRPALAQRRVVVTGIGAVSPLGLTALESFNHCLEGKSGISTITRFDPSTYDSRIAGEVKNFNADPFVNKKDQKKMDLFIQYSIAASLMAMQDSGLVINEANALRTGVFIGVGIGGLPNIEEQRDVLRDRGPGRVSPFFIPRVISNMAAGHISILLGAKAANFCITSACASGAHAIGEAARYIRNGYADIMIAGGSESSICPLAVGGFAAMKALSTRNDAPHAASRPWDRHRDGFVLGEGAGTLILEDYESAARRGAKIYAEVTGYAATSDAYHMTNPAECGEGGARAMHECLMDAGLNPEQIDYINAHGTSTPAGDPLESQAMETVFGEHAKKHKLWVSSTKSMTGHLLGAAGALESVFSVLSLEKSCVPPTINLQEPDDSCRLDYVAGSARNRNMKHVMNNSFGFGGTNSCLIFSKV